MTNTETIKSEGNLNESAAQKEKVTQQLLKFPSKISNDPLDLLNAEAQDSEYRK